MTVDDGERPGPAGPGRSSFPRSLRAFCEGSRGGGGGNRTRVRWRGSRTSPGAACYSFSQPPRSRRHVMEPGSVTVSVAAGPVTGPLASGLLADASYRAEGEPGLTDLRCSRSGGEGEVRLLGFGSHHLRRGLRDHVAFSARFPCIDDQRRNQSPPVELCHQPSGRRGRLAPSFRGQRAG